MPSVVKYDRQAVYRGDTISSWSVNITKDGLGLNPSRLAKQFHLTHKLLLLLMPGSTCRAT